jgi:tetratricopeptide (TPR) repeat protein
LSGDLKTRFPAQDRASGEGARLDEFLTHPDPVLVASLQAEEKDKRQPWHWLSISFLLLLLAGVTTLAFLLPDFHTPLNVGRNPGDDEKARSLVVEGREELMRMQDEKALDKFEMALAFAPHLPDGWAALGDHHLYNHQHRKAEGLLRKALALDPGYEPALQSLGTLAYDAGRQEEAEALLKRCSSQADLGRLYLHQGRFEEAARILEAESAKDPEDEVLRMMADAARAGRLTPEVEVYVRPAFPPGRSPFTSQGWALMVKGRPKEAVPVFEKALAEDPDSVLALNGKGWALHDSGRTQECRAYFERALSVQPDNPIGLNGRANCLRAEGRIEEAIADWKKMDSIVRGPSSAAKHLAWTYYKRGDCGQAAGYLAKLLTKRPDEPGAVNALEDCIQKLGRQPAPQANP